MRVCIVGQGLALKSSFAFGCAKLLTARWQLRPDIITYQEAQQAVPCWRMNSDGDYVPSPEQLTLPQWLATEPGSLIISANNTYLFSAAEVDTHTIINYHNALMPYHRGNNSQLWSIWNDDEVAGITWHRVDSKIDHGAILVQGYCPLAAFPEPVTSLDLLNLQHKLAQALLPLALTALPEFHETCAASEIDAQLQALSPSCQRVLPGQDLAKFHWGAPEGQMHRKRDVPHEGLLDLSWDFATSTRFLRAINGGALSFSARPQLDYHGQRYTIQRYSCDPAAQTLTLTCRPKLQLRLSFTAHGADVQELSSDTHHDRA